MAHSVANEDPGNFVPMFAIWSVITLAILIGFHVTMRLNREVQELTKRVEALEAAK